ncbi:MAG: alpha/beta fold hydrolase [Myxococcales bacterium]|nr:alpha/beta fold hydrolase [Myxococcales bacterium]
MRFGRTAVAALLFAACNPPGDEARSSIAFTPCHLPGAGRPAECGTLEVPLDSAAPAGERIALRVVRLRAPGKTRESTPLVLLAGGPGQAATEGFAAMLPAFAGLAADRDLVLFDQRGTGQSAPLDCPMRDDLANGFREGELRRSAEECLPSVAGRQLSHYSTEQAADDLEQVRAALGYEAVALYGVSYGTRLALRYAERHPARVRAMILDAVAPPELVLGASFAKDSEAALDGVLAACASEPTCNAAFPDSKKQLVAYLDALARTPAAVAVSHPRTGEPIAFTLTRDAFAMTLRGFLYAPELAALLPLTIDEVLHGRYGAFVAQAAALGEPAQEQLSFGLFLSVVCAEDVPRIDETAVQESRATLLGDAMIRELRGACEVWPVKPRPGHASATKSDSPSDLLGIATPELATPTLILSGGLDPVTPPRWGALTLGRLSHGRHLIAPEAGHGIGSRSCVPSLMRAFLARESAAELTRESLEGLDGECVLGANRPPFFIDRAGPRQ